MALRFWHKLLVVDQQQQIDQSEQTVLFEKAGFKKTEPKTERSDRRWKQVLQQWKLQEK